MSPHYQYIVVHQSAARLPGVLACQVAHAAGESCFDGPAPDDTHAVALVAETSEQLVDAAALLGKAGIRHVLIREPDAPYHGAAVALATTPTRDRERVRPFFAAFKVLR